MTESPEEYETRLAAYVEGRDAVAMQREAVVALARLMEGADDATVSRRPGADKWSVTGVAAAGSLRTCETSCRAGDSLPSHSSRPVARSKHWVKSAPSS